MKLVPDKQITAHLNTKQQKKNPTGARTRSRLLSDRSLLVGLGCLASLGLLSKGIVWAQAETPPAEQAVPGAADLQPLFEAPLPPPEPELGQGSPEPDPAPQAEVPPPEPFDAEPPREPEYASEPPPAQYYLPEPALIPLPEETAQEPPFEAPVNPAHAEIDQTDYSVGATNEYEAPTRIEFAERSPGCEEVGGLCAPPPVSEPVTADAAGPNYSPETPIADDGYIAAPPPRNLPDRPTGDVRGTVAGNSSGNPVSKLGQAVQQIGRQVWGGSNPPESADAPERYSADTDTRQTLDTRRQTLAIMPDLHLTVAVLQRPAWDSGRFKSVQLVSAAAAIQVLLSTISRRVLQACPEMATPACCFRYLLLRQLLRRLGGGLIRLWATAGFTPELTWGPRWERRYWRPMRVKWRSPIGWAATV